MSTGILFFLLSTYFTLNSVLISSARVNVTVLEYILIIDKSAMPPNFTDYVQWYTSLVPGPDRVLYTYDNVLHGMVAALSYDEMLKIRNHPAVLDVVADGKYGVHTTRTPSFLGLESGNGTPGVSFASLDVIVGVIDTGIWPESESFNDTGLTPVPAHWKGTCQTSEDFTEKSCNRKIVGARIFDRGYRASGDNKRSVYMSPRDDYGHGTHTAAIIAGAPVPGANITGYANGTAQGMAPGARIAVYKACWLGICMTSDIVAAVDQAVVDGVDILSISLGGAGAGTVYGTSYEFDAVSKAAFGAMDKGVFISSSAGNIDKFGPPPSVLGSVTNVSPWLTTVGASTIDRDFPSVVKLGNDQIITGTSLYERPGNLTREQQYPLLYNIQGAPAKCANNTLDPKVVSGAIVMCDRDFEPSVAKGQAVKDAGGLGMILSNLNNQGEVDAADFHMLPTVAVGQKEGIAIKQYATTNPHPTATIWSEGTRLGVHPSPMVASFTSEGFNILNLEIMKPDMVAPGVNILAAWTHAVGPSQLPIDKRIVDFSIMSGTSMSCAHVSGIAALIKAKHPDWSAAAIKSALMSTAYVRDNNNNTLTDAATGLPSTPYVYGAGHIDPMKALDPGLIHDLGTQDYIEYLCTRLRPHDLKAYTEFSKRSCTNALASPGQLNYPALQVYYLRKDNTSVLTLHRTVTNVGPPVSNYEVQISNFNSVVIKVEPAVLHFTERNQKLSYTVTFIGKKHVVKDDEFGDLIWKDGVHMVRVPIVVMRKYLV